MSVQLSAKNKKILSEMFHTLHHSKPHTFYNYNLYEVRHPSPPDTPFLIKKKPQINHAQIPTVKGQFGILHPEDHRSDHRAPINAINLAPRNRYARCETRIYSDRLQKIVNYHFLRADSAYTCPLGQLSH